MAELRIENVGYRYKNSERDALIGVSCVFESGKMNAVIGASGSGKSTFLSILAGLDKPMTGNIYLDGTSYEKLDLDLCRREQISMIFQAFHLFPLLTVLENVSYPMEQNGVKKAQAIERAKELLTIVDINKDKHQRYPSKLSGGEQQRVAIARALASGARIILADEPTGNLDSSNGEIVIDILRKLAHDEGYCIVIVTHNISISDACDKVFRMSDGVLYPDKEQLE